MSRLRERASAFWLGEQPTIAAAKMRGAIAVNSVRTVKKENEKGLTFDVRGRRSGEAAKGTHKRSLWAVPLDGMVRA